ncbi:mannose-1-phosphate guanylyltransferase/mannose-6-phosphate isomerase [Pseudomonas putida]|uniref:Alginate biosynthesis protein AlgA n=1 Tax=Pseudomonas putida TaxID=303 RepID=A0A2Z4RQV1_PSEPU|nr:mannose-1-phosphate guanylyltransferase/mannose-6-phosphate isomerase [Pseudomonas putida]AWY43349.1 mannose-1-phosphate guanylyltransferase/mannose-6-phosphate isomerase [Pseudomonas putida]
MIIPVILSGGAGTRLWPVSREDHPKPFMRLPDGQTLLEKTYLRAASLIAEDCEIVTVTNREHYFESRDHFARTGLGHQARFLLEPQGRNTASAIAVAALVLASEQGDNAVMVVMAADHLIGDLPGFKAATEQAVTLARQGYLVTYGIRPTAPETGFGYIEAGDALDQAGGRRVVRFVEKPDLVTAQEYLDSGSFLWNSGMFCFTVGSLINELQQHAPELLSLARDCVAQSPRSTGANAQMHELHAQRFAAMPNISIDYALMERSSRVAVVPGTFDWNDIGSWTAVRDLVESDDLQNRALCDAIFIDSRNTYVQSQGRVVATVGVDNLIVVETADAVLVAHADRAQEVRQVARHLKLKNHQAYRLHRTVSRPWGTYTVLEEGPRFKIKRIVVKPGAALSLQMHHHRSEHWIVVQGMAKVVNGGEPRLVNTNESTFIPAGHQHRLENPGVIDLMMIEVQSGEYLGEDDIVRFEDQYGRVQ